MSLTNRIIIPIVGSRQNLEEQNVFKHANLVLTPQKDQLNPQSILWKKSLSAFKKFKQKRDRKEKKEEMALEEPEEIQPNRVKIFFKLVRKRGRFTGYTRYAQLLQNQEFINFVANPSNKYCDPNEAPLHMENESFQPLPTIKMEYQPPSQVQMVVVSLPQICLKREESEPIQEQFPCVGVIETLPDDPFLIIRKRTSKKSVKSARSKLIKKQSKMQKAKSKESISEHPSIEKDKGAVTKKQNMQSQWSLSPDRFQKCSKQIMTLQQIVKSANEKQQQEHIKKIRLKDNGESAHIQKQASQKIDPD